jgi:hypothetical protein
MTQLAMFKRDIFYDTKSFDGKQFKLSPANPSRLIYCTKELAEHLAENIRNNGKMARVVKKQYTDFQDKHLHVAYVVYVRG